MNGVSAAAPVDAASQPTRPSRLRAAIEQARSKGRSALVIYLCGGDPHLQLTPRLVTAAAESGADIVEIGMPFSDPTADGIAIQHASERSLRRGTTLRGVLDAVQEARRMTTVPIVLYSYYNPILAYGEQRLVADAAAAGVDGMLVVDLPPEESTALRAALAQRSMDWIPLLAPTSSATRVARAASVATAFIYYVSLTGVTGGVTDLRAAAGRAAELRKTTGRSVAVGFGVKTAADVAILAGHADAVVVGSAVVQAVAAAPNDVAAVLEVRRLVSELAAGR